MNIGIDIDGTFSKYPEFFCELCRLFRGSGHKIYIITGLGTDGLRKRMDKFSFLRDTSLYDEIITTADYNYEERSLIGCVENNEEIVGRFKQRICKEKEVGIMFDDMAAIHRQFGSTPIFEVK